MTTGDVEARNEVADEIAELTPPRGDGPGPLQCRPETGERGWEQYPELGPLVFHHLPKTGGTSIITSILSFIAPDDAFSDNGNLTMQMVKELVAEPLRPYQFAYGHPDHDVCTALRGKARITTMMREPSHQIVSHYLHILRDSENARHFAAKELGFSKFLLTYKGNLVFQTISLLVGITPPASTLSFGSPAGLTNDVITSLPHLFTYLDEMFLVGTLGNMDQFLFLLSVEMGWPAMPNPVHLNGAAANEHAGVTALRSQLDEVARDPECALLLALEQSLYLKACSLERRAWDQYLARRVLQARRVPRSSALAHDSAYGQILVGDNLASRELLDGGSIAWWTGPSNCSRIYVKFSEAVHKLTAEIRIWHFVKPSHIHAFIDGQDMARIRLDDDAHYILEIDLRQIPTESGRFIEIQLYIHWSYPTYPPAYPCILLTGFSLE